MRVLGIDTSTKAGSVALIQSVGADICVCPDLCVCPTPCVCIILAEYTHEHSRDSISDSWLISAIDRLLQDENKIDGIAVVIGPGGFTGVRVGVSTAKGLGYALGVQIAGVISLDALAANIPDGFVCPIMDAMRGEVYAAFYEDGKRISEYMLIKPEDLAQRITLPVTFLGDGVRLWEEFFIKRLPGMVSFAPEHNSYIKAATVASMGMKMLLEGKGKQPGEIVPLYLRVSNAEERCK